MSTALDIRLGPKVISLIDKYGKSVTITDDSVIFDSVGSPVTNPVSQQVKITPPDVATLKYISGDNIVSGEQGAFVAASPLTITMKAGLKVTIDGEVWTVVNVTNIYTGEDIAAYGMRMKK